VPTIRDVAREAGVSIATVSRVINNTGHPVNEGTRARVLAAVKALDFRPSAVAKSLSTRRAHTIGTVIPDISNPYYAEIVRGIQDTAEEAGYTALLQNTDRSVRRAAESVLLFREKLADGIIFVGGVLPEKDIREAMGRDPIRGVAIGKHGLRVPSVQIDNAAAAADAVRHLVSQGHSRIALMAGPFESQTMQDRFEGFTKGMNAHGCEIDSRLVSWGALTLESGYRRMNELLSATPSRPSALIAGSDQVAIGAIRAIEEHGLSVAVDIGVVGFDNIPFAAYFCPPLTTIDIPRYQMGVTATRLLLACIAGKEVPDVSWLPTRLIVRESSQAGC